MVRRGISTKSDLVTSRRCRAIALGGFFTLGVASCGGNTATGGASGGARSSAQSGGAGSGSAGTSATGGGGAKAAGGAEGGTTAGPQNPITKNFFAVRLSGSGCLPRQLPAGSAGQVLCTVVEVLPTPCEDCGAQLGRASVSTEDVDAVRRLMREEGSCGESGTPSCDAFCLCAIPQLEGLELERCRTEVITPVDSSGFCYIDSGQGLGSAEITAMCPPATKRLLRFTGEAAPRAASQAFLVCSGF